MTEPTQPPETPTAAYNPAQAILTVAGIPVRGYGEDTSNFEWTPPDYVRDPRCNPSVGDVYYPAEAPEGFFVAAGYGLNCALVCRWGSSTDAPVPDVPPWGGEGEYRERLKPAEFDKVHGVNAYPDLRPEDVAHFTRGEG